MARKEGPELVFALIGATATDLTEVSKSLRHVLESEEYRVAPPLSDQKARELTNRALNAPGPGDGEAPILANAAVTNLLEFGRIVHAEMSALTEAARRGRSVQGGTLHCTTFPCHICARHIIGSGIARVVYIEPYQKSRAKELYPDSISVDGDMGTRENTLRSES